MSGYREVTTQAELDKALAAVELDGGEMSVLERFLTKVALPSRVDGCWQWQGAASRTGYGRFWFHGRVVPAHRVAFQLLVGPLSADHDIDHLCRNHGCVNPAHLDAVTRAENLRRGVGHGTETHCPHGHPYAGENLYIDPKTHGRRCRACNRQKVRRYRREKAAHAGLRGVKAPGVCAPVWECDEDGNRLPEGAAA